MLSRQSPQARPAIDLLSLLNEEFKEHRETFEAATRMLGPPFLATVEILTNALQQGGKLLLFGNGGSAADAQHIAAELIVRYKTDRAPIPALALTTDSSVLTACANDLGFDALFERQIAGIGRAPDVAIGISTSGRSSNVLKGVEQARHMGLRTIALTGSAGQEFARLCDAAIVVPSVVTARIQEMHIFIGHAWCKALEGSLGLL